MRDLFTNLLPGEGQSGLTSAATQDVPERLAVDCACGERHLMTLRHYEKRWATCGRLYMAVRPKRNGPMKLAKCEVPHMNEPGNKRCEWRAVQPGEGLYNTGCDEAFEFSFDGVKGNGFRFCPFCGGRIVEEGAPPVASE